MSAAANPASAARRSWSLDRPLAALEDHLWVRRNRANPCAGTLAVQLHNDVELPRGRTSLLTDSKVRVLPAWHVRLELEMSNSLVASFDRGKRHSHGLACSSNANGLCSRVCALTNCNYCEFQMLSPN